MVFASPSAPEMIRPSSSATGTPGQSGRCAVPWSIALSIWIVFSGCGGGERRGVRRVRVDDGPNLRTLPIDADVKAHARIGPAAGQGLEILVDEHHSAGGCLVEAIAELERPPGI